MKQCCTCKDMKPAEDFHMDTHEPDGRRQWCISCHVTKRRGVWKDTQDPARQRAAAARYRKAHPERQRAKDAVKRAVASGKLIRPNECSRCGTVCRPEGHHEDYARKLDVTWLCSRCHRACHRRATTPALQATFAWV